MPGPGYPTTRSRLIAKNSNIQKLINITPGYYA